MTKRVIVVSDSHGDEEGLRAAFEQAEKHGKIDVAVFLGDGAREFESVAFSLESQGTVCHAVRGNNDWSSSEPNEALFTVNGVRIFACHGHTRQVKYGLDRLLYAACEREARVALYGHTHRERADFEYSIDLINPGAVCERSVNRSAYAELLVEDSGYVRTQLVKWEP